MGNTVLASYVTEKQQTPMKEGMEVISGNCVSSSCLGWLLGVTVGSEYTQQTVFLKLQYVVSFEWGFALCEETVYTEMNVFFCQYFS